MFPVLRLVAVILLLCAVQLARADFDVPPAITVIPDDYPQQAAFFFPSGSPLQRFTARPGVWYAIYRLPMLPARIYQLLLGYNGDPARIKAYALDDHPFGKVNVKVEIPMRKIEINHASTDQIYASSLAIPADAANYGIYLLLECDPPAGSNKPIPVMLQLLTMSEGLYAAPGLWFQPKPVLESPLQSAQRKMPFVVPLPRIQRSGLFQPWGY